MVGSRAMEPGGRDRAVDVLAAIIQVILYLVLSPAIILLLIVAYLARLGSRSVQD